MTDVQNNPYEGRELRDPTEVFSPEALTPAPMTADSLKPVLDNVFVRQSAPNSQTKGGLYMPDRNKEWPPEGIVIAVGPGRVDPETSDRIPMSVAVGDHVLFARRPSSEIDQLREGDSHRYVMLKDEDIMAIIEAD